MARQYVFARAVKPKDAFGQPKAVIAKGIQDKTLQLNTDGTVVDGQKIPMGTLFGIATGLHISRRTAENGDVTESEGIKGNFEALPFDDKVPGTKAPVIWLATHIHEMIAPMLEDTGRRVDNKPVLNEGGAKTVGFAFEVAIKTSNKSPTGFTWEYIPAIEPSESDPLAELRQAVLPAPAAKEIEHEAHNGKDKAAKAA